MVNTKVNLTESQAVRFDTHPEEGHPMSVISEVMLGSRWQGHVGACLVPQNRPRR